VPGWDTPFADAKSHHPTQGVLRLFAFLLLLSGLDSGPGWSAPRSSSGGCGRHGSSSEDTPPPSLPPSLTVYSTLVKKMFIISEDTPLLIKTL